jgi:hypothetical protein
MSNLPLSSVGHSRAMFKTVFTLLSLKILKKEIVVMRRTKRLTKSLKNCIIQTYSEYTLQNPSKDQRDLYTEIISG